MITLTIIVDLARLNARRNDDARAGGKVEKNELMVPELRKSRYILTNYLLADAGFGPYGKASQNIKSKGSRPLISSPKISSMNIPTVLARLCAIWGLTITYLLQGDFFLNSGIMNSR